VLNALPAFSFVTVSQREGLRRGVPLLSEGVSDEPSPYAEEYGRERTREPTPLFDSYGNEHHRHQQIRKRQDYHSDPLNHRGMTRALPEKFIDRTATSKNFRPCHIFLAYFD
jgi:hypothetical protein